MRRATHTQPKKKHHPRCPRCGYDVSGDCDRWQDQCPLEGVCPECGLVFEWRYLLNPALAAPAWLFDTNTTRFWGPLAKTLVRSLWPPAIAKALRIEQAFRLRRTGLIALASVMLFHLSSVTLALIWAARGVIDRGFPVLSQDTFVLKLYGRCALMPYHMPPQLDSAPILWQPLVFFALCIALSSASFVMLTDSMRFAKLRSAHIVRAALFMVPAFALTCALWQGVLVAGFQHDVMIWLLLILPPLLFLLWWWLAVRRYLRMRHAFGVALAVVIIGLLTSMLAMFAIAWLISQF